MSNCSSEFALRVIPSRDSCGLFEVANRICCNWNKKNVGPTWPPGLLHKPKHPLQLVDTWSSSKRNLRSKTEAQKHLPVSPQGHCGPVTQLVHCGIIHLECQELCGLRIGAAENAIHQQVATGRGRAEHPHLLQASLHRWDWHQPCNRSESHPRPHLGSLHDANLHGH